MLLLLAACAPRVCDVDAFCVDNPTLDTVVMTAFPNAWANAEGQFAYGWYEVHPLGLGFHEFPTDGALCVDEGEYVENWNGHGDDLWLSGEELVGVEALGDEWVCAMKRDLFLDLTVE